MPLWRSASYCAGAMAAFSASGRACSSASAAIAWRCTSSLRHRVSRIPRSSRHLAFPISWTGIRSPSCHSSGSRSIAFRSRYSGSFWCRPSSPSSSVPRCSSAGSAACTSRSSPRRSPILTILIVGQQGYTGGINGITDLRTLHGWDIRTDHAKFILYFVEVVLLFGCIIAAQSIRLTKLGRILVAMREQEDRVRFSGYSVANFKIFAFCAAAVFAAIGGAMFTLEIGFMSPSFVGIVPSIEMVIYTAVGGRMSIFGAIWGSLRVNFAKTSLSESFPQLWLFGLGALFIAVVLAFPDGLSGIWADYVQPRIDRLIASRKPKSGNGWTDNSVADGAPAE